MEIFTQVFQKIAKAGILKISGVNMVQNWRAFLE